MVNFDTTEKEYELIEQIVARAKQMLNKSDFDEISAAMDITATHCNGCQLDLEKFLEADDFNFAHDFVGIYNHINRRTGQLERGFLPRFGANDEGKGRPKAPPKLD